MGGGPSKEFSQYNEDNLSKRYAQILQNFTAEKTYTDPVYGHSVLYKFKQAQANYFIVENSTLAENEEDMKAKLMKFERIMEQAHINLLTVHMCKMSVEDSFCSSLQFKIYKIMDFIPKTLQDLMNEKSATSPKTYFQENELWSLLEQMCSALTFIENHNHLRANTVYIVNQLNGMQLFKLTYKEVVVDTSNYDDCKLGLTSGRYLSEDGLKSLAENSEKNDCLSVDKFSFGMVLLSVAVLDSLDCCYDYPKFFFKRDILSQKFSEMMNRYSQDLCSVVKSLIFEDQNFNWPEFDENLNSYPQLRGMRVADNYQSCPLSALPVLQDPQQGQAAETSALLQQQQQQQQQQQLLQPQPAVDINSAAVTGMPAANVGLFGNIPETGGGIFGNSVKKANSNMLFGGSYNMQTSQLISASPDPQNLFSQPMFSNNNNINNSNMLGMNNNGFGLNSNANNNNGLGGIFQSAYHSPNMTALTGNMNYNNPNYLGTNAQNTASNSFHVSSNNNNMVNSQTANIITQYLAQLLQNSPLPSQQQPQQQSLQQLPLLNLLEDNYSNNNLSNNNANLLTNPNLNSNQILNNVSMMSKSGYSPLRGAKVFHQFNNTSNSNNNNLLDPQSFGGNALDADTSVSFQDLRCIPRLQSNITYPDGSTYEGQTVLDFKDGYGKFTFSNNGIYEGMWKMDRMHGQGILQFPNGDIAYQGDWYMDQFNNLGHLYNGKAQHTKQKFDFKDFSQIQNYWLTYDGEFCLDQKHGFGTLVLTNGEKYVGNFRDDKVHGTGVFYFLDGSSFSGYWEDNMLLRRE